MRWSARVEDNVPSPTHSALSAQVNRQASALLYLPRNPGDTIGPQHRFHFKGR